MSNKYFFVLVLTAGLVFVQSCTVGAGNDNSIDKKQASETPAKGKFYKAPKAITELDLRGVDSDTFTIADYEGKVVLINLWATWCGPCIEEMPYFNKLHDKYGDDGFMMIGLNADDESEKLVNGFVEEQKLKFKVGWAEESLVREFFKISNLQGLPQSLLLNREGEMIGMYRGGGKNVIKKMVESVEKEMDAKDSILDDMQ